MRRAPFVMLIVGLSLLVLTDPTGMVVGATTVTSGTVAGTFRIVGGPAPGMNKLVGGVIIFSQAHNNDHHLTKVAVTTSGSFTARLGVGIWTVYGRTNNFDNSKLPCGGFKIAVSSSKVERISVQCDVP